MRWWHLVIAVAVITATVLATMGLYRRYVSKNGCSCTAGKTEAPASLALVRDTSVYGMGGKKMF